LKLQEAIDFFESNFFKNLFVNNYRNNRFNTFLFK